MKIGIIGAGAMGSLLGFYLSAAAEVWLLDLWQAQVDAITTAGLRCELDGVVEVRHPRATSDPAAIGPCDVVLVLVKAHQTAWAATQACRLLRPAAAHGDGAQVAPRSRTVVVTLQNGVGNREVLEAVLGPRMSGRA
jgi:2-dehydropantoate 2-reductase